MSISVRQVEIAGMDSEADWYEETPSMHVEKPA